MTKRMDEFIISLKMQRPPCPVCDWPLWMTDLAPSRPDYECRLFLCPRCEHEESRETPLMRVAA
jgi:hypothetical protein